MTDMRKKRLALYAHNKISPCNNYACFLGCPRTQNRFPDNATDGVMAFWIGARRRNISDCNSTFEWTLNNRTTFPVQYSNWATGEPSCAQQREACASLNKYTALKWNDLMCTWSACPFCELTINV